MHQPGERRCSAAVRVTNDSPSKTAFGRATGVLAPPAALEALPLSSSAIAISGPSATAPPAARVIASAAVAVIAAALLEADHSLLLDTICHTGPPAAGRSERGAGRAVLGDADEKVEEMAGAGLPHLLAEVQPHRAQPRCHLLLQPQQRHQCSPGLGCLPAPHGAGRPDGARIPRDCPRRHRIAGGRRFWRSARARVAPCAALAAPSPPVLSRCLSTDAAPLPPEMLPTQSAWPSIIAMVCPIHVNFKFCSLIPTAPRSDLFSDAPPLRRHEVDAAHAVVILLLSLPLPVQHWQFCTSRQDWGLEQEIGMSGNYQVGVVYVSCCPEESEQPGRMVFYCGHAVLTMSSFKHGGSGLGTGRSARPRTMLEVAEHSSIEPNSSSHSAQQFGVNMSAARSVFARVSLVMLFNFADFVDKVSLVNNFFPWRAA